MHRHILIYSLILQYIIIYIIYMKYQVFLKYPQNDNIYVIVLEIY